MEPAPIQEVTGLVLAGGSGTRMGGIDKGLAVHDGRALVASVTERLAPQVGQILISCNRNHASYLAYASAVVSDSRAGFQGPLAGIESCRGRLGTPLLAVVACDTPALPVDLVDRLARGLGAENGCAFANDGQRAQYLFALIRRRSLATLAPYLDAGGRSVKGWYELINARAIDFSDQPAAFININRA